MRITLLSHLLLAASTVAAPIQISYSGDNEAGIVKLSVYQSFLDQFNNDLSDIRYFLTSKRACIAHSSLTAFQQKLRSFTALTSAWEEGIYATLCFDAKDHYCISQTRDLHAALTQFNHQLSRTLDVTPTDITGEYSEQAYLAALSRALAHLKLKLSTYNDYLDDAVDQQSRRKGYRSIVARDEEHLDRGDNGLSVAQDMSSATTLREAPQTQVTTSLQPRAISVVSWDAYTSSMSLTSATFGDPTGTSGSGWPTTTAAFGSPTITSTSGISMTMGTSVSSISSSSAWFSSSAATIGSGANIVTDTITITATVTVTADSGVATAVSTSGTSNSTFDIDAQDNLVVYYGQSQYTNTSLLEVCRDPNVDIVNLAFLNTFFGAANMPGINFGSACTGSSPAQQSQAPDLLYCEDMAKDISSCQSMGKKVMLSLGGAIAQSTFPDDDTAATFAQTVWDLFGGGTKYTAEDEIRPFGNIKLDGFDINNESHDSTGYVKLASTLRDLYASDTSQDYYLSFAPQCPFPDFSDPDTAMSYADFVWVQFYNNYCAASTPFFVPSLAQWSQQIAALNSSTKVYIGLLGWEEGGMGYVAPDTLKKDMEAIQKTNLTNFGGIMLWDGSMSMANIGTDGSSYLSVAKSAIQVE